MSEQGIDVALYLTESAVQKGQSLVPGSQRGKIEAGGAPLL
jgi:hypothetical protein